MRIPIISSKPQLQYDDFIRMNTSFQSSSALKGKIHHFECYSALFASYCRLGWSVIDGKKTYTTFRNGHLIRETGRNAFSLAVGDSIKGKKSSRSDSERGPQNRLLSEYKSEYHRTIPYSKQLSSSPLVKISLLRVEPREQLWMSLFPWRWRQKRKWMRKRKQLESASRCSPPSLLGQRRRQRRSAPSFRSLGLDKGDHLLGSLSLSHFSTFFHY